MHFSYMLAVFSSWEEVTALAACLGLMGAIFVFATSSIVAKANANLLKDLAEIYYRKDVAEMRLQEIERHFDYLRDKVKEARA